MDPGAVGLVLDQAATMRGPTELQLRSELEQLDPRELKQRARGLHVDQGAIEALDSAGDVKSAAIDLVVHAMLAIPEGPVPSRPPPQAGGAARTTAEPHRQCRSVDSNHPFCSCLDRPWVQKQIRWAQQYNKNILVLVEKEPHRPGFFDYAMATEKYAGTEWEFILDIDAIQYQRDKYLEDAMVTNILGKADTRDVPAAQRPINPPGVWEFFLSHHQELGGDQMKNLSLLFERNQKPAWYENGNLDKSEKAMHEGVKHSKNFVLLLTGKVVTDPAPFTLETLAHAHDARNTSVDQWIPKRVAIWLHGKQNKAHWNRPDLVQKVEENDVTGQLIANSPAEAQKLLDLTPEQIDQVKTWVRNINDEPDRVFEPTRHQTFSSLRKAFNQEKEAGWLTEEEVEQAFEVLKANAALQVKAMEECDPQIEFSDDSSDEDQDARLAQRTMSVSPNTRTVPFPQWHATRPAPEPSPELAPEPAPEPTPEKVTDADLNGPAIGLAVAAAADSLIFDVEMEDSTRTLRRGTAHLSRDMLSLRLGPVQTTHTIDQLAASPTVEGECAKQKPTRKKRWPTRYAKIEGRGLFFYDSKRAAKPRESSIRDVTGCRITSGTEKFPLYGTWYSIILERKAGMSPLLCERANLQGTPYCSSRSGVVCYLCEMYETGRTPTALDPRSDGFTRICFKYSVDRDRFFNALQNLAHGYPSHDAGPFTILGPEHPGAGKAKIAAEELEQERHIDLPLRAFAQLDTNLVSDMIPENCIEAAVDNGHLELSNFSLKLHTATLREQLFTALVARQAAVAADAVKSSATMRDLKSNKTTEVLLHLQATVLRLSPTSGKAPFEIAMETVAGILPIDLEPGADTAWLTESRSRARSSVRPDAPCYCIDLSFLIGSTFRDSEVQPDDCTRLEFLHQPQRDRMLAELRTRLLTARLAKRLPSSMAANGLTMTTSTDDVPASVQLKAVVTAEDFADYVFRCTKADGTHWHVQKRFREFVALRQQLTQLDSRVLSIPFPKKLMSPRSSVAESTVANRRAELESWTVAVIGLNTGGQANPFAETLRKFFMADEAFPPKPTHTMLARQRKVVLPLDTADVNGAMMGILQLLPAVTRDLLQTYCGGAAKEGWVFKEGERHSGWKRRWMMLWPAEPHPSFGRILVYFESPDATKAKGAIQILAPVVKAPKTPRKAHFCIRVHANKIVDATNLDAMRMRDRKFILGTYDEDSVREWIEQFRASGPAWKPNEVDADYCGWLKKKSTKGIGWWTKEWMELREGQLVQQQRTASRMPKARWKLDAYTLYVRPPETRSREWEFILIPKVAAGSGSKREDGQSTRRKVTCVYFNADSGDEFDEWRTRLLRHMDETDPAEAERQLMSLAPPPVPGQSLDDFDVMNVLGKGAFGMVLLVKKKRNKSNDLMAMKKMDKEFIVKRQQEHHVLDELNVMRRVQHPFIIALYNAFQTSTALFLVMEFMQGGDLYVTMQQRPEKQFTEAEARFIAAELCLALCHLHSLDIVFRDLKPENVMFDLAGHVRLIDFGLAKQDVSGIDRLTVCGTPVYMSPEIARGVAEGSVFAAHPKAIDWWAFGALIYEMVFGNTPFVAPSFNQLMVKVVNSAVSFPIGHNVSEQCVKIIRQLLDKTESLRLGSEDSLEVQQHEWFDEIDFDALFRKELCPVYVPEARDEPLAHFPGTLTEQVVDNLDFQSPAAETRAALAMARDKFETFDFRRSRDAPDPAPEPELETDAMMAPA